MADAKFAGTAYISVSGKQMAVRANCIIHAAKAVRTGIAGMDGTHGFSQAPVVQAIEFDISMLPGIVAEDIQAMEDETVMAEAANGTVYTLRNAWKAGPAEHNLGDGTMKLRFEGMDLQEYGS